MCGIEGAEHRQCLRGHSAGRCAAAGGHHGSLPTGTWLPFTGSQSLTVPGRGHENASRTFAHNYVGPCLSLRQPPARLLAMIARNMASRAGALIVSPFRTATVRAVLLVWPPVMIPSGSGTMAPS